MAMLLNVMRYFFRAMTGAYGLNLVLFILAHYFIGERWVVIAFFNSFIHLLILPSFLLLPICLILREWRLAAWLVPSLVFFALNWGALFLPNDAVDAQNESNAIAILSYNMGASIREPEAILKLIRQADADVVALQELSIPFAAAIESQLSELYPYMALHPMENSTKGQGLLSRFALSEDRYWEYDFLPVRLGHQRVFIEALDLSIYNLHPSHPAMGGQLFNPSFRGQEIADILSRANAETGNVILVGDFNMPDLSSDYGAIRRDYGDAFWEVGQGMGWTFTVGNSPAFLRLDYLFYRGEIAPIRAEILRDRAGSDHHPILFEILLGDD